MVIAGAGGHSLEVLDILLKQGFGGEIMFFDDYVSEKLIHDRYLVTNKFEELEKLISKDRKFVLGVGNPVYRQKMFGLITGLGGELQSLMGKNCVLSDYAVLSQVDIMNMVFVGSEVVIGKGSLVNTGAQVHHEVKLGEFCEVSPKAVLLGGSQIGDNTRIGAGATVLPNVRIGSHVIVGAGSVINRDVPDNVTVVGVPGRIIKRI